jgi:hypothetical protein
MQSSLFRHGINFSDVSLVFGGDDVSATDVNFLAIEAITADQKAGDVCRGSHYYCSHFGKLMAPFSADDS